ncbi:MAG: LexA family transcriptional regulator [Bacteroidales bacterium]|nr:LexA family transcriptional regulator [Bacteroidales bacterium]
MYFPTNIRLLRKRRGRTQDDVAFALNMKRSTLSGYENRVAEPGIGELLAFSKYFNVAIDTLVRVDLSKLSESQLSQLEKGYDVFITGSKLRVLATTVNADNEENIEMVGEKAKAGYASGYADPEYISVLPTFRLPFLSKERKYRAFQVTGDSMHPIPEKSWVIGEFIQNWNLIQNKHAYILLTTEEGVVFKVVENKIKTEGTLILYSLNPFYKPYVLPVTQLREAWKFVTFLSSELPEPNMEKEELVETIRILKNEVKAIQTRLNL